MVSNLLYLVRRRWSRVEGLGDLSSWLAFHVAFGVAGVALVFVHAAMLYDNPIARASLIAAGVVLVTGVVGRWIYAQVPHRPDGHEQDEGELVSRLRGRLTSVRAELRTAVEDVEHALTRLVAPPVSGPLAAAGRAVLAPVTYLRVLARAAAWRRRLAQAPYGLSRAEIDHVLAVAGEVTVLRRAFRRQTAFKQVVGAWRGVHRIATFILLLTLVTHVVTVLYFSVG
jgi:VIT1/CCC1 family predicted Fe2+/Mn2+ transporter